MKRTVLVLATVCVLNGQVTLSRQEVEHLRNLAWWAKDAAQRIGR